MRAAREWTFRPADEWRWILYANTMYGRTPLKQAIKDAGDGDPGTGSTFEALEKRGYILTHSAGATEHHRSELMVYIRFTLLDDLQDQILAFIAYYNRTMAKPIKWTYTELSPDRETI